VLVGLFWFPDGFSARSRAWPQYRLTMSREGVELRPSTPKWLPPWQPLFSYEWHEIAKVERTQRGLRFRFDERGRTFVVGSLAGGQRLARAAGESPLEWCNSGPRIRAGSCRSRT
jgi:hypothetical protein